MIMFRVGILVLCAGSACAAPEAQSPSMLGSSLAEFQAREIRLDAHPEWPDETKFEITLHRSTPDDCSLIPAKFSAAMNGHSLTMIEDGLFDLVYEPGDGVGCGPVVFEGPLELLADQNLIQISVYDDSSTILYELDHALTERTLEPRSDTLAFDGGSQLELDWVSPTNDDYSYDGGAHAYIDDGQLPIVEWMNVQYLDNGVIIADLPIDLTGPYQAVVSYPARQPALACHGIEICTHWVRARFDSWITLQ